MSLYRSKTNAFRHHAFIHFGRCQWCNAELDFDETSVDHVTPLGKGGNHRWDNLALSCRDCNKNKGTQDWGRPRFGPTVWTPLNPTKEVLWPATLTYSIDFNVHATKGTF